MGVMDISPRVEEYIQRGFKGDGYEVDELVDMFNIEPFSADYFAMLWAQRKLSFEASGGIGEVHAQIGLDALPCSKDCLFCSFAASNNRRPKDQQMLSLEEIIDYANAYVEQGANTITLMITADYDFERYLEIIAAVREAVGPEMPLMANMGDFTVEMAERMKAVGIGSVYHAVRMGEGVHTKIPMETRFETLAAANETGLKIASCAESIGPEYSDEHVAKVMKRLVSMRPQQCGAWSRLNIVNTRGENVPGYPQARVRLYSAVFRLLAGPQMRFGGTHRWAEVGTNPRDHSLHTEKDGRVKATNKNVAPLRKELEDEGFTTYLGPSKFW